MKGEIADQLLCYPNALHLLTVIAYRARWKKDGVSLNGLKFGEAFIGDYAAYGLKRKADSCARKRLEKWGLVEFRPTVGVGTIARLLDTRAFEITDERDEPKKGQQQGQLILEVKSRNGDISGADKGPSQGHLGGINSEGEKDRQTESSERRRKRPRSEFIPLVVEPSIRHELRKEFQISAAGVERALEQFNADRRPWYHKDGQPTLPGLRNWFLRPMGQTIRDQFKEERVQDYRSFGPLPVKAASTPVTVQSAPRVAEATPKQTNGGLSCSRAGVDITDDDIPF